MIPTFKHYINREASKMALRTSSFSILVLIAFLTFVTMFGLWAFMNFLYEATLSEDAFARIVPEAIVSASASHSGEPVLQFTTPSGYTFERGVYTPNFQSLREAVESQKQIMIWFGNELWFPAFLRALMPKSQRPIFQIAADGKVILSFETMKKHYRGEIGIGIIFLTFAVFGCLLVGFFLYALRLRLRPNGRMDHVA